MLLAAATVISRVLNEGVKRGMLAANPAADSGLRLKVTQRRGNFLEADELLAVIDAGGAIDDRVSPATAARGEQARQLRAEGQQWREIATTLGVSTSTAIWLSDQHPTDGPPSVRRVILATLGCAGLRNGELCALNVADLDFEHGFFIVRDAKTAAGIRRVDMTPWLRGELLAYFSTRPEAMPDEPAFPTRAGGRRDRNSVNRRVIGPAVRAANALRAARGEQPLPDSISAHTFRRTYITLMLEAGAPVPYVQSQVGHEDATTTLNIYAQVLRRRDRQHHGHAFDALMGGTSSGRPSDVDSARPAVDLPGFPSRSGHRNSPKTDL